MSLDIGGGRSKVTHKINVDINKISDKFNVDINKISAMQEVWTHAICSWQLEGRLVLDWQITGVGLTNFWIQFDEKNQLIYEENPLF